MPLRYTLAVAAIVVAPWPALTAFELLGPTLRSGAASYRVNPNFPGVRAGTEEQQIEVIRCSADAWANQSGADVRLSFSGRSDRTGTNGDGFNNISWVDEDGGEALAVTMLFGTDDRIADFDIVFFARTNGDQNVWFGPRDPPSETTDIGGVAVHEFGHALGLAHSRVSGATMFASVIGSGTPLRTLHADDRDGARFLYGAMPAFSSAPTITAIEPAIGPLGGGNEVLLLGTNFTWTADTTLRIGGRAVSRSRYDIESACTMRVAEMPGAAISGSASVEISNELGEVLEPGGYTYSTFELVLESIRPDTGIRDGGTPVTITGANFAPGAVIFVGEGVLADLEVVDASTIVGTTPLSSRLGVVDLRIVRGEQSFTLPDAFHYVGVALRAGSTAAVPGQTGVEVDVEASTNIALRGISFVLAYDSGNVAVNDIAVDGTVATDAAFASPNVDNAVGVATFGIVMDFLEPTPNIPPGANQTIAVVDFAVSDTALLDSVVPLELRLSGGLPLVKTLFTPVDSALGLVPALTDGSIVVSPQVPFIRGDANLDGRLDIADPTFLLGVLFLGTAANSCLDASDANDDGKFDVSDAVYTLNFLFRGTAAPLAPHPDAGADPTDDDLDCI